MAAPETLARVERACAELLADSLPVTFAATVARARVSRATLYRDESLRAVVEEYRQANHDPLGQCSNRGSLLHQTQGSPRFRY